MSTIERATRRDVWPLAAMLARAFTADPFHNWLFPQAERREPRSRALFRCELRNVLRDGVVLTTAARDGASLWGAPGKPEGGWLSQAAVLMTLWRLLGVRTARVLDELQAVGRMRPQRPHWYLSVIGTEPRHQGRGIGTALMRAAVALVDERCEGAWLEVANPALVAFYSGFGFVERDRVQLENGPQIIGMWRNPRR